MQEPQGTHSFRALENEHNAIPHAWPLSLVFHMMQNVAERLKSRRRQQQQQRARGNLIETRAEERLKLFRAFTSSATVGRGRAPRAQANEEVHDRHRPATTSSTRPRGPRSTRARCKGEGPRDKTRWAAGGWGGPKTYTGRTSPHANACPPTSPIL
eukprot:6313012-Pyramimonas_sp.AAC.1